MLDFLCSKFSKIITVEDGTIVGGFGSAVNEYVAANHSKELIFYSRNTRKAN